jgi:type I restriction enzyme S subunit
MRTEKVTCVADVAAIAYGRPLPRRERREGRIPVYGSGGIVGWHNRPLIAAPALIIGRKGNSGKLSYCETPSWVIDTAFYITDVAPSCDKRYLYYALQSAGLDRLDEGTAVPSLQVEALRGTPLRLPPLVEQKRIAERLSTWTP